MSQRLAIDCDLRRIHAITDAGVVVCSNAPDLDDGVLDWAICKGTILFEIAGAVDYTDSKAIAHNKRRWGLWNMAQAVTLDAYCREQGNSKVLVAPSSVWTKGYDKATRWKIAQCKAPTKDLRDAEAMLFFFEREPERWVTLAQYLETL